MQNKIHQLIDKLVTEKDNPNPHCDLTSSRVKIVNTPIPSELFAQLEVIASEYNADLNCIAGDFLTLALNEAIAHLPEQERQMLEKVRHEHEQEDAKAHQEQCQFNAGGT